MLSCTIHFPVTLLYLTITHLNTVVSFNQTSINSVHIHGVYNLCAITSLHKGTIKRYQQQTERYTPAIKQRIASQSSYRYKLFYQHTVHLSLIHIQMCIRDRDNEIVQQTMIRVYPSTSATKNMVTCYKRYNVLFIIKNECNFLK